MKSHHHHCPHHSGVHHHHHSLGPQQSPSPSHKHSGATCCSHQPVCSTNNPISLCCSSSHIDQNGPLTRGRTTSNIGLVNPDHCGHLWSFSTRSISLFALSLVFILVWSSVISGVLVTHSYKEHESARHMVDLFIVHKDVGQLMLSIGKEMLSTLNSSLHSIDHSLTPALSQSFPSQPNLTSFNVDFNSSFSSLSDIHLTSERNDTDLLIEQISKSFTQKGFIDFDTLIQDKLGKLRFKCLESIQKNCTHANISYSLLVECVRTFEKLFYSVDSILLKENPWLGEHSKLTQTDFALRSMPYSLFVRGMIHRFTALGMGLLLVRPDFDPKSLNISEYLQYYFSSRQQLESSFMWNVRFFQKYIELDSSEYYADLLINSFNNRRLMEQDSYLQMSKIFGQLFNYDSLSRIRNHIKKKNVESVERILVNGSNTKYVTDQDANLISIQLDSELLESFGLGVIEKVVLFNTQEANFNLSNQYNEVLRNQIGFMARVQDFLNVSVYSHLAQTTATEQHGFLYHSVVAFILILSVLFCFTLFTCTYFCGRHSPNACCAASKNILSRRGRRRFWNIPSFFLFKQCFSSNSATSAAQTPSTSRYPLLYKSSHHSNNVSSQLISGCPAGRCCPANMLLSTSPTAFLVSSTTKRTFAGGVINRYFATPIGNSSSSNTKTALLTYKFENSRNSLTRVTETTSLMNGDCARNVSSSRNCCHSCCPEKTVLPMNELDESLERKNGSCSKLDNVQSSSVSKTLASTEHKGSPSKTKDKSLNKNPKNSPQKSKDKTKPISENNSPVPHESKEKTSGTL